MYQIPATTLNQIAQTVELKHPAMAQLFLMDQGQLTAALEQQAEVLAARGLSNKAILAYQTVMPLLLENEAISRYITKTGSSRRTLPEVTTIAEALNLALQEFRMTPPQLRELKQMLAAQQAA